MVRKHSADFGKKEKVLNYTCQTYQLSRPSKVGEVMALIRQCQPSALEEWENWYFENAETKTKNPTKMTRKILDELGTRLHEKITQVVIPEWQDAFNKLTLQDCKDYIYNLTINRTFDGYIREKSVINDCLQKIFPKLKFEESPPEMDHACDIDYTAEVASKLIGFQIKPITATFSFANYSPTERMKKSFIDFEEKFGGKVFVIFSDDGKIANEEIIEEIRQEIERRNLR